MVAEITESPGDCGGRIKNRRSDALGSKFTVHLKRPTFAGGRFLAADALDEGRRFRSADLDRRLIHCLHQCFQRRPRCQAGDDGSGRRHGGWAPRRGRSSR